MTTMKKIRKLNLNRETLTTLDVRRLAAVRGGVDNEAGPAAAEGGFSNNYYECSVYCSLR
jgi:natural product precursor